MNADVGLNDWATDRAKVVAQLPARASLINLETFRAFHDSLAKMNRKEIIDLNSQICEQRSHSMATYTLSFAAQQSADVIFMSFGALHTHGILEQLRAAGASAIVYSPNFRSAPTTQN